MPHGEYTPLRDEYVPRVNFISRTGAGVVGGVGGGVGLALLLWIYSLFQKDRDFIKLYGQLVNDDTISTSLVMLLVTTGAIGGVFGAFLGRFITGQIIPAIGVGLVYGMIIWVLLPMLILPLFGDGRVLNIGDSGGIVVLGLYTLFGSTTTVIYAIAGPRRKYYYRRPRYYGAMMAVPSMAPARRRSPSRRRKRKSDDD